MKQLKSIFTIAGVIFLALNCALLTGQTTSKSVQTKPKTTQTTQTKPKPAQTTKKTTQAKPKSSAARPKAAQPVAKPAAKKIPEPGTLIIGTQTWAAANLDVIKFRNGDSIPQAKTFDEWVKAGDAGKPAWCYYNNDPVIGKKYGKLYNWFAVNDPRGLAPAGWSIPEDKDWALLANSLGGPGVAGAKLKSTKGWAEDNNGNNESGFNGFPGGYRVENGKFINLGSIGTWWSLSEDKSMTAFDHYLMFSGSFTRSSNPKQRGESVRCIRK
jgi:uncharacterized protein (TIGR02145 family)